MISIGEKDLNHLRVKLRGIFIVSQASFMERHVDGWEIVLKIRKNKQIVRREKVDCLNVIDTIEALLREGSEYESIRYSSIEDCVDEFEDLLLKPSVEKQPEPVVAAAVPVAAAVDPMQPLAKPFRVASKAAKTRKAAGEKKKK